MSGLLDDVAGRMSTRVSAPMKTFIKFEQHPDHPARKTNIWDVKTNDGFPLGNIRWYSPWRRYVFNPVPNTVFDSGCLTAIVSHIDTAMEARRTS